MAKVASALHLAGRDVRCLDLLFEDDPYASLTDAVSSLRPDVIGLSLRNIESSTEFLLPEYKRYVDHIRSVSGAPVVVGGPGFSVMPEQVMRYLDVGLAIAGEGDTSLPGLIAAIESGDNPHSVPNVCTYKDGLYRSAVKRGICDPSEFAGPNWSFLPVGRYDMVGVQSKRGCSFGCVYCTYPNIEGRRMRLSEPSDIAAEISGVRKEYGVEAFYFVDNVFNNPKSHAVSVCNALIDADTDAEWGALVSPVGFDPAFAGLMKEAGCMSVEIGADSLSEASLRALGKSFGPAAVMDAISACRDAGLMHMVFLILGGPDEDEDTLKETFDRLDGISPDKVFAVSGVRIYPNTPIAARAVEEGVISRDNDLLLPEFYVSPKLGGRLYELADAYFDKHPDWIHYRADGVSVGGKAVVSAAVNESIWSDEAESAMIDILGSVPRLLRPIAGRAVRKKAAALASKTGSVSVDNVRDAFMSETPGPFRKKMVARLKEMGLV
jgi:radical SAM superfamily enzyme YgiQ (UPF0313 family)